MDGHSESPNPSLTMPRKSTAYTFATPSLPQLRRICGCDVAWFKHWDKLWKVAASSMRLKLQRAFISGVMVDKKEDQVLVVVVANYEDRDDFHHFSGTSKGNIRGVGDQDEIPFSDELFVLYPTPRKGPRSLPPFDF